LGISKKQASFLRKKPDKGYGSGRYGRRLSSIIAAVRGVIKNRAGLARDAQKVWAGNTQAQQRRYDLILYL
jgi:hypothetical protein